jgi:hypothetical protein
MSATELLHQIEALPEEQRRWLVERLRKMVVKDQADWARFSTDQLAGCYAPEDSVYDEE